jgi:NADPH-dependent F420 reductase
MTQLGFLGGTGDLGKALAIHLASNYEKTLLGSREKPKAEDTVRKLQTKMAGREYLRDRLVPATNVEVAEKCDVIIATLPAKHAVDGVKQLAGHFRGNQLLISTVAPTPKVGDEFLPSLEGKNDNGNGSSSSSSITQQLKETTGLHSIRIATAFQTVPADTLMREERFDADVPITSDTKETYETVANIVKQIEGLRPLYLGSLQISNVAEGLTSVLLNVGTHNHIKSPAIKFFPASKSEK